MARGRRTDLGPAAAKLAAANPYLFLREAAEAGADALSAAALVLAGQRADDKALVGALEALPPDHWVRAAVVVRASAHREGLRWLSQEGEMGLTRMPGAGRETRAGLIAWLHGLTNLANRLGRLAPFSPGLVLAPLEALRFLASPKDIDHLHGRLEQLGRELAGAGPTVLRGLATADGPEIQDLRGARRELSAALSAPLADGRPAPAVRLFAGPEALAAFCAAHRGRPGWRGATLGLMPPDTAINNRLPRRGLWLSAAVAGQVEGRELTWVMSHHLGESRLRSVEGGLRAYGEVIEAIVGRSPDVASELEEIDGDAGRLTETPAAFAGGEGLADGSWWPLAPPCRHEGASWERVMAWARLWCPDCRRELCCVPRQRLSRKQFGFSLPHDPAKPAFLHLAGIGAALAGEPDPRTVRQMTGYGDAPALDPADYAVALAGPRRAGGSLGAALRGGR